MNISYSFVLKATRRHDLSYVQAVRQKATSFLGLGWEVYCTESLVVRAVMEERTHLQSIYTVSHTRGEHSE